MNVEKILKDNKIEFEVRSDLSGQFIISKLSLGTYVKAEKIANELNKALNEPTTEADTSKASLNIPVVSGCPICGFDHKKRTMY